MGLTVLVVDDEQKLRELLHSYLEREGLGSRWPGREWRCRRSAGSTAGVASSKRR
jgi:CheY-like chemotaxis protein